MEKKMQLQKKANVIAANGQSVGHIERIVLNPASKVITDIVVQKSALFSKEEKVVPITLVAETTEDQVVLSSEAGELESFPPFEERRVVAERPEEGQPPSTNMPTTPQPVNYGVPGMSPTFASPPGDQYVTQMEQNIPEGTVAMKEGAKVITSEGEHVGNVERVFADTSVDQITHLLITRGMFTKEAKLIPLEWIMTMGEDSVHLRVNKDSVEELDDAPIAA